MERISYFVGLGKKALTSFDQTSYDQVIESAKAAEDDPNQNARGERLTKYPNSTWYSATGSN
jgi:hypothetical protein